jgi:hypothetical protein
MDERQQARRWPLAFLTAFAVGAVLWGIWMIKIIRDTRERRDNSYTLPSPDKAASTNPPASTSGTSAPK